MPSIQEFIRRLRPSFRGELSTDDQTLDTFSHDASLFELRPQLVAAPQDADDVATLIATVRQHKPTMPSLSLTARSAGTDMSGGAVNDSIIVDMRRHLTTIREVSRDSAHLQPGVFFRDFDAQASQLGAMLPSYPASRELCTVGGMVANNSGGEKSLQHGKTANFVTELQVALADGNLYTIKPLHKAELVRKMSQKDFEGKLYAQTFELLETHYDEIQSAKPQVSKDSTGYHLWDVWNRDSGIFDLTKLFVGSQGTLGLVTDIHLRLVPAPKHSGTLIMFLRDMDDLGTLINDVLQHKPASFEGFDNHTLMLSFKLFFFFHKRLGWGGMIHLGFQLLPDLLLLTRGIPKMVLLIEFDGDTPEDVAHKVHDMRLDLTAKGYGHESLFEEDETEAKAKKFWIMRRESFNLLRQMVKDKHTAPFIDDLVVPPARLPQFLPELRTIIKKYGLLATIQGHMGDGNFHVIPLMKIEASKERAKLEPAMKEVNTLVLSYGGSISGEHNDGLVRGPWLERMYGPVVYSYMKQVKHIFDPDNIFNPHKKTDATWDYSFSHIREHF